MRGMAFFFRAEDSQGIEDARTSTTFFTPVRGMFVQCMLNLEKRKVAATESAMTDFKSPEWGGRYSGAYQSPSD